MRCKDCPRFDLENSACLDGKLNPQSLVEAVEVALHIGPRAICMVNDFREEILDIQQGNPMQAPPRRRPHTPSRRWKLEI